MTLGSSQTVILLQNQPHLRKGGAISSAGQCRIMSQNNILHEVIEVVGEMRTTSAIPFFGGHRMALGCFGLHANGCFNA